MLTLNLITQRGYTQRALPEGYFNFDLFLQALHVPGPNQTSQEFNRRGEGGTDWDDKLYWTFLASEPNPERQRIRRDPTSYRTPVKAPVSEEFHESSRESPYTEQNSSQKDKNRWKWEKFAPCWIVGADFSINTLWISLHLIVRLLSSTTYKETTFRISEQLTNSAGIWPKFNDPPQSGGARQTSKGAFPDVPRKVLM